MSTVDRRPVPVNTGAALPRPAPSAVFTRVYRAGGRVAHLRPEDLQYPAAPVCQDPRYDRDGEWLGTGTQEEYERAASLPLCQRCAAAAPDPAAASLALHMVANVAPAAHRPVVKRCGCAWERAEGVIVSLEGARYLASETWQQVAVCAGHAGAGSEARDG
jgi:hypothetical protein